MQVRLMRAVAKLFLLLFSTSVVGALQLPVVGGALSAVELRPPCHSCFSNRVGASGRGAWLAVPSDAASPSTYERRPSFLLLSSSSSSSLRLSSSSPALSRRRPPPMSPLPISISPSSPLPSKPRPPRKPRPPPSISIGLPLSYSPISSSAPFPVKASHLSSLSQIFSGIRNRSSLARVKFNGGFKSLLPPVVAAELARRAEAVVDAYNRPDDKEEGGGRRGKIELVGIKYCDRIATFKLVGSETEAELA